MKSYTPIPRAAQGIGAHHFLLKDFMAPYRGATGGIDPTKQTHTVSSLAVYMVYTVTSWLKDMTNEDFAQRCAEWHAACAITFL